jgi:hypothetical protein
LLDLNLTSTGLEITVARTNKATTATPTMAAEDFLVPVGSGAALSPPINGVATSSPGKNILLLPRHLPS